MLGRGKGRDSGGGGEAVGSLLGGRVRGRPQAVDGQADDLPGLPAL